jgi:hypothetical protein
MDMSSMDMGSMDMSNPLFRTYNEQLSRDFWYIIAGVVGAILVLRAFEEYGTRSR